MEYNKLGKSGLSISRLSLGSWVTFGNQVNTRLATKLLGTAFDAGINFFDNAEAYAHGQSEIIMGKAIKKLKLPRDQIIVSSKVFWGGDAPTQLGLSRKHIFEACHAALKRLQLDYLDLYFCHRPDPTTPIEETVWAMSDLVQQGKVFYWGTSEWSASEIMQAHSIARQYNLIPPTMEQPEYNLFHRDRVEDEYARLYDEVGLGTTIWSPLASGILTGKYNDGVPENSRAALKQYDWKNNLVSSEKGQKRIAKVQILTEVANELGCSMAQLALAWCLKNTNVSTVILGASKVEQLQENLRSLDFVEKLTADVMQHIDNVLNTE